jgi:hypothetical protein
MVLALSFMLEQDSIIHRVGYFEPILVDQKVTLDMQK